MARYAKCHKCGARIYPRKSKTTGKMSLRSGIRQHYWDKHRTTMLRGARQRRKNPGKTYVATYYCNKCRRRHRYNSAIGKSHIRYRRGKKRRK